MISVVIPFHNEEKNVLPLVYEIEKELDGKHNFELVLIDDRSTDGTLEMFKDMKKKYENIKIAEIKGNGGFGEALRRGFKETIGNVIVTMDGDLSHQPKEIMKLLDKFNEGYDLVIGSRFVDGGYTELPKSRVFLSKNLAFVVRKLGKLNVKDVSSGFRAYNAKILKGLELKSNNFEIQVESLLKFNKLNCKVAEVPVHYIKRKEGKSNLNIVRFLPGYVKVLLSNR